MKICHVISTLFPKRGGPPVVVINLACAQAALGHSVTIASYSRESLDEYRSLLPDRAAGADQVRILYRELPARLGRWRGEGIVDVIEREKPDVVQIHGIWEPELHAAARVARKMNIPYVFTPHGMLDPWTLDQKKWKKSIALAVGVRRLLNGAAYMHVLNRDEAELLEPVGLKCPSVVVPNGMFLEAIEPLPEPGTFYARYPHLEHRPYVLFLSRLHYKKGLDYLADAFAQVAERVPEVQLVVAGPDDGERADFESRTRRAGVAERVHVIGPIYGAEKFAAFVDAQCFCLPSRQEGFSIAITEALACGVPVVISRACHFPEVEEVGAGVLVDLEPSQIASALSCVLGDDEARQSMGRAGAALVRERFTWPVIAERTIRAYEDVAAGRTPRDQVQRAVETGA